MMRLENFHQVSNTTAFSLIEVLIAIAIFSMVAVMTVQGTLKGFDINKKVSTETDYYHNLRIALWQFEKDITLAFHASADTKLGDYYRRQTSIEKGLPVQYKPISFFIGLPDKVLFSSSSHKRLYKDSHETDTCEISYFVRSDEDDPSNQNLKKRESSFIDNEFDEGGITYKLLDNVDSVRFRYFTRKGFGAEGKWVEKWDSTEGEFRFLFPEAVEITIVMNDPFKKDEKLTFLEKVKVINPNNQDSPKVQGSNSFIDYGLESYE